jgi:hypothetical protein
MQIRAPGASGGAGAQASTRGSARRLGGAAAAGGGVLTGSFLLWVVGAFLALFCLAQLWVLGFMGGAFGTSAAAADKAKDKKARAAAKKGKGVSKAL